MAAAPARYAYIDALRAIAVAAVIVSHVKNQFPDLPWRARALAEFGAHGVQLFFVASALTLTLSWQARADGAARFYLRRLWRIAPLFWLAVAGFASAHAAGWWPSGGSDQAAVALTAAFLHALSPRAINLVVPGGWSIGVEMAFYAVFPLVAAWTTTRARAAGLAAGATAACILANGAIQRWEGFGSDAEREFFLYYGLPSAMPSFAIGILLAYCLPARPLGAWTSRGLLAAAAAGSIACAWSGMAWFSDPSHLLSREIAAPVLAGALVLALAGRDGTWLVNPATRLAGRVSFSAYLVHFALVIPAQEWFGPVAAGPWASCGLFLAASAAGIAATVAVSTATHRWIEEPGIRAGAALIRWLDKRR